MQPGLVPELGATQTCLNGAAQPYGAGQTDAPGFPAAAQMDKPASSLGVQQRSPDRPVLRFLEQNFGAILGVHEQTRSPGAIPGVTAPRAVPSRSSGRESRRISASQLPAALLAQLRSRCGVTQRLLGALHGSLDPEDYTVVSCGGSPQVRVQRLS